MDSLRIDSWLWRTRFFKSRGLASTAVSGGKVHVNGARVKSSREIRPGDCLDITHPSGTYRVTVRSLPPRRGPAAEAQACFLQESFEPRIRRPGSAAMCAAPPHRPDKKSRRQLRALKMSS